MGEGGPHFSPFLSGEPTCCLPLPWLLEPCLLGGWVLGSWLCAEGSLGGEGLCEVGLLGIAAALQAWASKNCRSFGCEAVAGAFLGLGLGLGAGAGLLVGTKGGANRGKHWGPVKEPRRSLYRGV